MNGVVEERWRHLLEHIPEVPADAELILRNGKQGPSATIRYVDRSPRVFLRGEGGVSEQSPAHDEGLPGAELLGDAGALAAKVAQAVGGVRSTRLVSWRPGRRAVVRIVADSGEIHWLKLLDRKSYRRATRAFDAIGPALAPLHLMVPYTMLPGCCGYVAHNATGVPLSQVLASGEAVCWANVTRALLAVGYTELRGPSADDLPTIDFTSAQAAAVNMLQKGAVMRPELGGLAGRVCTLPMPDSPATPAMVHGDLHDKQIFVGSRSVSLIDLEGLGVGDTRFDFINLAEHVRLRDLQKNGADSGLADFVIARCCLDSADPDVLAFRAVIRARLVGVYALRPRWRELVALLQGEVAALVEVLK